MRIVCVEPGSVGDELGLVAGDELTALDGYAVEDVFDYEYYNEAENFSMSVMRNGELLEFDIEKYPDEDLGLEFDREMPPRTCRNHCMFCFVDQLPKGELRPTLKVKDDDYRHSFLSGTYVTLTNVTDAEIERIIRLKLSPLYISVHSADPQLRLKLLGIRRAPDLLSQMQRLHAGGIAMHAQIVYCPDINEDYIETARAIRPYTESLAIVPVGLTAYSNPAVRAVTPSDARRVVANVRAFADECLAQSGTRYMFASDELYLKAGLSVPPYADYEDFVQIENGVGLVAMFLHDFEEALRTATGAPGRCSIATGVSAYPMIAECAKRLTDRLGGEIQVYCVENRFFGSSVTVAGLITGGDLLRTLKGCDLGERLLLPAVMLREFGDVFLDNMTVGELSAALETPIEIMPPDGESFVTRICKK